MGERRSGETSSGLADLLAAGESQTVEFKSTARWNVHAGQADKKMEHVIVKTVCGFLNAEGGTLLIGVDDDGAVVGLDADMQTLGSKGNRRTATNSSFASFWTTTFRSRPQAWFASASRNMWTTTSASCRWRRPASRPSPRPTRAVKARRTSGFASGMRPNSCTVTT